MVESRDHQQVKNSETLQKISLEPFFFEHQHILRVNKLGFTQGFPRKSLLGFSTVRGPFSVGPWTDHHWHGQICCLRRGRWRRWWRWWRCCGGCYWWGCRRCQGGRGEISSKSDPRCLDWSIERPTQEKKVVEEEEEEDRKGDRQGPSHIYGGPTHRTWSSTSLAEIRDCAWTNIQVMSLDVLRKKPSEKLGDLEVWAFGVAGWTHVNIMISQLDFWLRKCMKMQDCSYVFWSHNM